VRRQQFPRNFAVAAAYGGARWQFQGSRPRAVQIVLLIDHCAIVLNNRSETTINT
jgi:hypothetical protein